MCWSCARCEAGARSGGCIEDDLIFRFTRADAQQIRGGPSQRVKYGITTGEAHHFGLLCGETLELLLKFDPDAASLTDLVGRLEQVQLVRRAVQLKDGTVDLKSAGSPTGLSVSDAELANTFGPVHRMLIIGAIGSRRNNAARHPRMVDHLRQTP